MISAWHNEKIFTEDEIKQIRNMYVDLNMCTLEIAKVFNVSRSPINKLLKKLGVLRNGKSNGRKINLSETQKEEIRNLYLVEYRSAKEIGNMLNVSSSYIDKYLANSSFRRSRSEATKLSVTGRKVSVKGIENMRKAQQILVLSGKRKQTGGVCKTYIVNNLKCQGMCEKKYIEILLQNNKMLPCQGGLINTPFGVYYSDFQFKNKLIEVKSPYTYEVLLGEKRNRWNGKFEYKQLQKIKWINENVMPVEIVIVDKNNIKNINLN